MQMLSFLEKYSKQNSPLIPKSSDKEGHPPKPLKRGGTEEAEEKGDRDIGSSGHWHIGRAKNIFPGSEIGIRVSSAGDRGPRRASGAGVFLAV